MVNTEHIKPLVQSYFKTDSEGGNLKCLEVSVIGKRNCLNLVLNKMNKKFMNFIQDFLYKVARAYF